jgi:predicted Holliday junction resolvase-like endonuclease
VLFYTGEPTPDAARSAIEARRGALEEGRRELREFRARPARSERLSIAVNLADVLERVVPTLDGFGLHHRDCRALSDPIDYIAFNGLTRFGRVDSLTFIDVKMGEARLNRHQQMIRDAVDAGDIIFKLYDPEGKGK